VVSADCDFGIVTIAHGSDKYLRYAINLARSLERTMPWISRCCVTDSTNTELLEHYNVIVPFCHERGQGVEQKLWLPEYSPYTRTLFIDSDSLVVRDCSGELEKFADVPVSVVGAQWLSDGEWFGDIARRCAAFGVEAIPKFNGGVYFFNNSVEASAVFAEARSLVPGYSAAGFTPFRTGVNEEPLMSVAIARSGYGGNFEDHGRLMRTPIGLQGRLRVDVESGTSRFSKNGRMVEPSIVHFAGEWSDGGFRGLVYRREALKLQVLERKRTSFIGTRWIDTMFAARHLASAPGFWARACLLVAWRSAKRLVRERLR
jgi:hypothetical protein